MKRVPDLAQLPKHPAVIIGEVNTPFAQSLVSFWRDAGLNVVIVLSSSEQSRVLEDGTLALSVKDYPELVDHPKAIDHFYQAVRRLERLVINWQRESYTRKLDNYATPNGVASVAEALRHSWRTVHLVRAIDPLFVWGMETFYNGVATGLCTKIPRFMLPYSRDIYQDAHLTVMHRQLVRWSLRHIDLICPSATSAADYIVEQFNVRSEKVQAISWGVDRDAFQRVGSRERAEICGKYGIDPEDCIILNSRRFREGWGAEPVLNAMKSLFAQEGGYHMIIIGATDIGGLLYERLKTFLRSKPELVDRVTFFERDITLDQLSELMAISDIFLSLPTTVTDMRSASILQAASCGAAPVLSEDQPEYAEMERLGFHALFVNPLDSAAVVDAVRRYRFDKPFWERTTTQNQKYLDRHEDRRRQMRAILQFIEQVCHTYGRTLNLKNDNARRASEQKALSGN